MKTTLQVAVILASATTLSAQSFPEVGARALGLAGAYVAVADGATGSFWNPAAAPLNPPSSTFLYGRSVSDPEDLATRLDDLAATDADAPDITSRLADALRAAQLLGAIGSEPDPIFGHEPIGGFYTGNGYGIGLYRLTLVEAAPLVDTTHVVAGNDPETSIAFNTSRLNLRSLKMQDYVLSVGSSLGDPRVMLGASARLTRGETRVSSPTLFNFPGFQPSDAFTSAKDGEKMTNTQLSFDVGTLLSVHSKLRLGVVGKYLGTPEFETADGGKMSVDPRWRSGFAYFASPNFMLSGDIDLSTTALGPNGVKTRNGALGAQLNVAEGKVALRAGVRESLEGPNTRLITGGFGYIGSSFVIDAAVGHAPSTGTTSFAIEIGYRANAKKNPR